MCPIDGTVQQKIEKKTKIALKCPNIWEIFIFRFSFYDLSKRKVFH